jgi:hypothetical protein
MLKPRIIILKYCLIPTNMFKMLLNIRIFMKSQILDFCNLKRLNEIDVEWMTEFQRVARIATRRPWNEQVVIEVTSWNETFLCTLKRKKNVVWWNKLKWLLNVLHRVMKLYSLGMGIKATLLEGLRISLTM